MQQAASSFSAVLAGDFQQFALAVTVNGAACVARAKNMKVKPSSAETASLLRAFVFTSTTSCLCLVCTAPRRAHMHALLLCFAVLCLDLYPPLPQERPRQATQQQPQQKQRSQATTAWCSSSGSSSS